MNELTKEQLAFFDRLRGELAESLKSGKTYAYNIVHEMNIDPSNLWMSVDVSPPALCGLFAYIEHVTFDLTHDCGHSLAEREIVEIVDKFYFDITYLPACPAGDHYEVDLYVNWERHAPIPYEEGMPELHRDGLLDFVRDMSVRNDWKQERVSS